MKNILWFCVCRLLVACGGGNGNNSSHNYVQRIHSAVERPLR